MPDTKLCLEALSALVGCCVESTTGSVHLTPQDFINIVALREFFKQEGLKQLEYQPENPGLESLSLQELDDKDMYNSPPALTGESAVNSKVTVKINLEDFFHPEYNYDFTNIKDGETKFMRGNERYYRPCGWNRLAIRVIKKYDGGDDWLGTGSDAWPVSYHGSNMDGSSGVILGHQGNPGDEPQFLEAGAASLINENTRGRGVYSTPDIKMAEKYCKTFRSKVDGKRYKVLLQNRINPEKRTKCQRDDVWLVYIPDGTNDIQSKVIVQDSIRPYGLLLKQL
ncbi:uncharacterized protein ACNS7B_013621 [Menidia menidia]|uniref:(Atlantic silverside) hypothetical protein n=1 Tax=Menidia menidia TaxID=238744 RepID=A0A8S4ATU2_9TELE|nr:unnamed protein product [Menidia menidia]